MRRIIFCYLALLSILLASCSASSTSIPTSQSTPTSEAPAASEAAVPSEPSATEATMSLELTSDAFVNGQSIPTKYSCKGNNISPALAWNEPPAGTKSLALIVDDPDAPMGTWVHWVLFNIPASTRSLQEDLPASENEMSAGKNSSGNMRYDGPCPPSDTHRYFFKLYALDTTLSLSPGATKDQLLKAMQGHILTQGELMGTFSK